MHYMGNDLGLFPASKLERLPSGQILGLRRIGERVVDCDIPKIHLFVFTTSFCILDFRYHL